MLAPKIPLQLLAQYEHVLFPQNGASTEERRSAIETSLKNCYITRDVGTDQMRAKHEPDILEDIHQMRAAALTAISLGEAALRTTTLEDFNQAEREFRTQYVNLIRSVKSFLWDAGETSKRCLWPLVEELM